MGVLLNVHWVCDNCWHVTASRHERWVQNYILNWSKSFITSKSQSSTWRHVWPNFKIKLVTCVVVGSIFVSSWKWKMSIFYLLDESPILLLPPIFFFSLFLQKVCFCQKFERTNTRKKWKFWWKKIHSERSGRLTFRDGKKSFIKCEETNYNGQLPRSRWHKPILE